MITIYTGKPGSGKSYNLTRLVKQYLENGDDVFCNFKINETKLNLKPKKSFLNKSNKELGTLYHWKRLEEFRKVSNAIIIMDEAQTYFNARRWKNMTAEDEIKFQQHRKQGIDIIGAVQNLNRCDTVLRELAGYVYEMKRIGKLFICKRYTPEDIKSMRRESSYTEFFWFKKSIAEAYDTAELINVNLEAEAKNKFIRMSYYFSDKSIAEKGGETQCQTTMKF